MRWTAGGDFMTCDAITKRTRELACDAIAGQPARARTARAACWRVSACCALPRVGGAA
ncbi:hypothetical protein BMAPRL20_A2970 [Burkholderia mallei PRL-20]|uniref:Uncharacterized protein n=2 Tax=pseudomallei group TaxID=111527 RepID=A2S7E8_BURM9|nr:hypothetical protein BMA10229_A1892 [Burkholderia mallei NCTC 10229]EBA47255.1 hypothetical protein BURPS305_3084 [Burkholderia pseudomallei 305]EDO89891.1 hypothetical protein BURPSPAST_Y0240 [Burkholderia pseudomallei Pasteur 52237]EES44975.1 hypothetical protein BMAPRL20_A2970 [Burkholderia mallei PRL-20]EET07945.1 hypothetical protein BURPS1710A_0264 [Burkholderia pseudomallei 1710a]